MRGKEREEFLMVAVKAGLPPHLAQRVARHATTHERMAEAACNGDYPCDNGVRKVIPCPRCEGGVVKSDIRRGVCSSCRAEAAITAICSAAGVPVSFQGDPRGWTVKVGVTEC